MFYCSSFKRSQVLKEQIYLLHNRKKEDDIFDAIIDVIKTQHNFSILIKLIDDPIVRQYLFHDKLRSFWDGQLVDKQSLHDNFGLKHLILKPHPIIPSLHLLIGHYFFDKYERARQEGKERFYFDKAIEYGCFEAILTSNNNDLDELLKETEQGITIVGRIVTRMTRLANLHATPGFIMFANTCGSLINYWANIDDKIRARESYELALQNLYVANKLLPYSGTIISNVFGEEGFRNSYNFNIHNISSVIDQIIGEPVLNNVNQIISELISIFSKKATQEQIDKYLAKQELAHYSQLNVPLELTIKR